MLRAQVANTLDKLESGLMFVRELEADAGMLFVFPKSRRLSFWGRNTYIPLDIAFVDHSHKIVRISEIKPFSLSNVSSEVPCLMAIEANKGYFLANAISVGDTIVIDHPSEKDDAHIIFRKPAKDFTPATAKIKESQIVPDPMVVPKPGEQAIGQPINPVEQVPQEQQNLPVLDMSDLADLLEDSHDQEENKVDDGLDGQYDQLDQEKQRQEQEEHPVEEKEYPVFANMYDAEDWAEKNNEVMRISYTTKSGRKLVRDVEPHGKFHADSTSNDILVTYDETVGSIRAFIMSNVGNWAFVGRQFQKKFVVKA